MKNIILFILLCGLMLCSCTTPKSVVYSTYETTAISSDLGGEYTLRVQGKGISRKDAYANAGKQAVHDIIFKNIHQSYGNHSLLLALINDPGLESKNQNFFDSFFSDNGRYKDFIIMKNKDTEYRSNQTTVSCITSVTVNRNALKTELINEGILK